MHPFSSEVPERVLAAAFRVAVGDPNPLSEFSAPPAPSDWGRIMTLGINERVLGPLVAAVEAGLPVTEVQREELMRRHGEAMASACTMEASLGSLLSDLQEIGVDAVVLKGMATAHLLWPDPSLRQFGDIDLLVSAADLGKIVDSTRAAGGGFRTAPIGPTVERVQKGVTTVDRFGHEIDIHQAISWGPKWLAASQMLLERTQPVALSHVDFVALDETALLFHAAVSVQQPRPRLSSLFDLALLMRRQRYDETGLRELTAVSSAGLIVDTSFAMAQSWWPDLRAPKLGSAQESGRWPVADRFQMFAMPRLYLSMLASIGEVPAGQRVSLVRELMNPSAEWRSGTNRPGRAQHLREMSRKVLSRPHR